MTPTKDPITFNKDFFVFLVLVMIAPIPFFGASYRVVLLSSFGVPISAVDFDLNNILIAALSKILEPISISILFIFILIFILVYFLTNRGNGVLHYASLLFFLFFVSIGAAWGGFYDGRSHARLISSGDHGIQAFCTTRADRLGADAAGVFKGMTERDRLRILEIGDEFHYFAVVSTDIARGQNLAIANNDINFCRFESLAPLN